MINPINLLVNSAEVTNPTESSESGTNAGKLTFGSSTTYACSIQPLSASESLRYGRDYPTTFARIYFPTGTSIDANARIEALNNVWKPIGPSHEVASWGGSAGAATRGGLVRVDCELEGPIGV